MQDANKLYVDFILFLSLIIPFSYLLRDNQLQKPPYLPNLKVNPPPNPNCHKVL